jgi:membrane protein required for colicin V production
MIAGFSWVDWLLAAVLLVSTVIGLWRGLVYELLALVGWVVAFIAAQLWGAAVAPWLPFGAHDGLLRVGAAYGLVFIGTLIAWTLMAKLVRLLILLVVAFVVTRIPPASRSTAWQSSHGAAWLANLLNGLDPLWPRHHPTQAVGRA